MATISIYKIAQNLDLYLNNFIDCQEDLELILHKLPSQIYTPLLNKLEQNMYTFYLAKAKMGKRGAKLKIKTLNLQSLAIEKKDLTRNTDHNKEDDAKVTVTVIPLSSIISYKKGFETMFLFLRDHLPDLQGSLLIDAVFD